MAKFSVRISYNTSEPSTSISAYRLDMVQVSDDFGPVTDALENHPPAYNNVTVYKGVFPSKETAAKAIIEYVAAPCILVEDPEEEIAFDIRKHGKRGKARIIASRTPQGTFLAS